jgi:hypothetical protein
MLFLRTIKNNLFVLSILLVSSCGNQAYEEVENAKSKHEVIGLYKKYTNLNDDNDFIDACVTKLEGFNLTQFEIDSIVDIIDVPTNLNLIVVPDFSNRLTVKDNQNQANKFDIPIIEKGVFNAFYSVVAKKAKSPSKIKNLKDRLVLDLTDSKQAGGIFLNYVDSINIDFSVVKRDVPPKKYLENRRSTFNRCVNEMYIEAEKRPLGADYYSFFRDKLYKRIEKNTLKEKWVNKVVIITDGYLEPDSTTDLTNIFGDPQIKPIPETGRNFYNCEVYICQINKRIKDKNAEINVLKRYWGDWFKSMKFKNVMDDSNDDWWEPRNESTENAISSVHEFIFSDKISSSNVEIEKQVLKVPQIVKHEIDSQPKAIEVKVKEKNAVQKKESNSQANSTLHPTKCSQSYNEIYALLMDDDLTSEKIQEIIKKEEVFLSLDCDAGDKATIKKNKDVLISILKSKQ